MATTKGKKTKEPIDDFGVWIAERRKNEPKMKKALEEREAQLRKWGTLASSETKKTPAKKSGPPKAAKKKK